MKKHFLQGLRISAGITLVLLGLIGLVVPILQGWLFIFLGLFLIHPAFARKMREKYKAWRERRKQRQQIIDQ